MQIKNYGLVEKIQKSGFTDNEAKVYVSLLELGGAYPSKVAEYSGINRSTVYHTLLTLSVRGLVNEIEKRNKLFYQIEKPDRLEKFANDQIRLVEDRFEKVKTILPDVEGLFGSLGTRPKITYYEGAEGLLNIYNDHINVDKPYEMLAWANANELRNFLPANFFDIYVKTKEKIGITTRGILPDTPENRGFNDVRYKDIRKNIWPEMRYLNVDSFPLAGEITIYGNNKISIANFKQGQMVGVIIEDEAICGMMKTIFELSWSSVRVGE